MRRTCKDFLAPGISHCLQAKICSEHLRNDDWNRGSCILQKKLLGTKGKENFTQNTAVACVEHNHTHLSFVRGHYSLFVWISTECCLQFTQKVYTHPPLKLIVPFRKDLSPFNPFNFCIFRKITKWVIL